MTGKWRLKQMTEKVTRNINGKNIYPFPKTERMVYYNKVVKDICETCHRLKPQTCIREQQSFRWDTKVILHELNKAVNFYHNNASGIPKHKKIT